MTDQISELQAILIKWGLVDPPMDGTLGKQTLAARKLFSSIYNIPDTTEAVIETAKNKAPNAIRPLNDNVALVIEECQRNGYYLSRGVDAPNIIYIEGVDPDFEVNSNAIDYWNDLRTLLVIEHNGRAYFRNIWRATINSGRYYTDNPLNDEGAANIEPGQYWSWQVGRHITSGTNQEALVQVRPVAVRRDGDQNGRTKNDKLEDFEIIGLNQHGGSGARVGRWSAGCLVVDDMDAQQEFVNIEKTDRRYKVNPYFIYPTIVLTNNIFK